MLRRKQRWISHQASSRTRSGGAPVHARRGRSTASRSTFFSPAANEIWRSYRTTARRLVHWLRTRRCLPKLGRSTPSVRQEGARRRPPRIGAGTAAQSQSAGSTLLPPGRVRNGCSARTALRPRFGHASITAGRGRPRATGTMMTMNRDPGRSASGLQSGPSSQGR
jgi:hypothetical protein